MSQALTTVSRGLSRVQRAAEYSTRRCDPNGYLAKLVRVLGITPIQAEAWEMFAETLKANWHRMSGCATGAVDDCDNLFGALQDRLAALGSMRSAARALCAVMTPEQMRRAEQVLPLCCLPAPQVG